MLQDAPQLTHQQGIVVGRILAGANAWISARRVKIRVVDELVNLDLVERWSVNAKGKPLRGGPFVTLTCWGAYRFGVYLVEHGDDERPRWVTPDYEELPVRVKKEMHERVLKFPEMVPDRRPGPEYLLGEDGEPLRLFSGGDARKGVKVTIDPKLKRKRDGKPSKPNKGGKSSRGGGGRRAG